MTNRKVETEAQATIKATTEAATEAATATATATALEVGEANIKTDAGKIGTMNVVESEEERLATLVRQVVGQQNKAASEELNKITNNLEEEKEIKLAKTYPLAAAALAKYKKDPSDEILKEIMRQLHIPEKKIEVMMEYGQVELDNISLSQILSLAERTTVVDETKGESAVDETKKEQFESKQSESPEDRAFVDKFQKSDRDVKDLQEVLFNLGFIDEKVLTLAPHAETLFPPIEGNQPVSVEEIRNIGEYLQRIASSGRKNNTISRDSNPYDLESAKKQLKLSLKEQLEELETKNTSLRDLKDLIKYRRLRKKIDNTSIQYRPDKLFDNLLDKISDNLQITQLLDSSQNIEDFVERASLEVLRLTRKLKNKDLVGREEPGKGPVERLEAWNKRRRDSKKLFAPKRTKIIGELVRDMNSSTNEGGNSPLDSYLRAMFLNKDGLSASDKYAPVVDKLTGKMSSTSITSESLATALTGSDFQASNVFALLDRVAFSSDIGEPRIDMRDNPPILYLPDNITARQLVRELASLVRLDKISVRSKSQYGSGMMIEAARQQGSGDNGSLHKLLNLVLSGPSPFFRDGVERKGYQYLMATVDNNTIRPASLTGTKLLSQLSNSWLGKYAPPGLVRQIIDLFDDVEMNFEEKEAQASQIIAGLSANLEAVLPKTNYSEKLLSSEDMGEPMMGKQDESAIEALIMQNRDTPNRERNNLIRYLKVSPKKVATYQGSLELALLVFVAKKLGKLTELKDISVAKYLGGAYANLKELWGEDEDLTSRAAPLSQVVKTLGLRLKVERDAMKETQSNEEYTEHLASKLDNVKNILNVSEAGVEIMNTLSQNQFRDIFLVYIDDLYKAYQENPQKNQAALEKALEIFEKIYITKEE